MFHLDVHTTNGRIYTETRICTNSWEVLDFDDAMQSVSGGRIADMYDVGNYERTKCLITHMAAGILWAPEAKHNTNRQVPKADAAQRLSRDIMFTQYEKASGRLPHIWADKMGLF